MKIEKEEIEQYLLDVRKAVENNHYRLDRNSNRQDINDLFWDYVVDEAKVKEIVLSLTFMDFSEITTR